MRPHHLAKLEEKYYRPFGARLCRAPKGRMERSHRIDDEEFYIPCLGEVTTAEEFLALAQRWQWYYNVERPHFGAGMEGRTPMERLWEWDWIFLMSSLRFRWCSWTRWR